MHMAMPVVIARERNPGVLHRICVVNRSLFRVVLSAIKVDTQLHVSLCMAVMSSACSFALDSEVRSWRCGQSLPLAVMGLRRACYSVSRRYGVNSATTQKAWGNRYGLGHAFSCAVANAVNQHTHLTTLRQLYKEPGELHCARMEVYTGILKHFD